jgi:ribonuclease HII
MIEFNEKDLKIKDKIKGMLYVCGCDEAAAGNFSGNLIVAACILDPNNPIEGLNDSKKLTAKKRFELYPEIIEKAIDYCIIEITPEEIDNSNILAMRMEGMKRAIEGLKKVDYVIIDGNRLPEGLKVESDFVIKGDLKFKSVSAASILAKTTVDKQMIEHDKKYPEYGFAKHKGYGTKIHKEALEKHGPCEIHRMSYKPVRESMTEKQFEKWKSRTKLK